MQHLYIRIAGFGSLLSDDGDHRQVFLDRNKIRMERRTHFLEQAFLVFLKQIAPDDKCDRIDPRQALFERQLPFS